MDQWVIGYQYFGGITNWINPAGTFPSFSPIKISSSKPYWALAADLILRAGGAPWGVFTDPRDSDIFAGSPPHRRSGVGAPVGANEVFADGSARWVGAKDLRFFHSWIPSRLCYFYQQPDDFPANLISQLNSTGLKINP